MAYLVLNVSRETTQWCLASDLPHAKARAKLKNWINAETIVCKLNDGWFEPVLQTNCTFLFCFEAHQTISSYLAKYLLAVSNLPSDFPLYIKLRKIR